MSEKMKNFWIRTLSGAVLAVVVLGAVAWCQWSFGALLALLLVGGMREFYALAEAQEFGLEEGQAGISPAGSRLVLVLNGRDGRRFYGSEDESFGFGLFLFLGRCGENDGGGQQEG